MYTREQIAETALSLRGVPFRHQGRTRQGVDCCGLLYVMLVELGYPNIVDVEGYRSSPPASLIYKTLAANFDEIAVSDAGLGDIFLMRIMGRKPKHVSVLTSTERDVEKGIEPQIVHAHAIGGIGRVVMEPFESWKQSIATAFRLRGVV